MRSGLRNVLIPLLVMLALPVLLTALLWLLLPVVALPLAKLAAGAGITDGDVIVSRLELDRPGANGVRIAVLEVQSAEPIATLRAEGINIGWRLGRDAAAAPGLLDGALHSVRVARLDLEVTLPGSGTETGSGSEAEAGFDWAAVLPSALRAQLPIDTLQLDAVRLLLRVGSETLRGNGRLLLEPRRMELEATVESERLALPVRLDAGVATDDRFHLQLDDPQGSTMLSAEGLVEIEGSQLTLTGGAHFDTVTLGPALGLELPPVVGDLTGMLRRDGERITLRLDPGTALGAHLALGADGIGDPGLDGDAGAGASPGAGSGSSSRSSSGIEADSDSGAAIDLRGVGLAVRTEAPFTLTIDADRLGSDGALSVSFASTGSTQLDGRLELAELGGTLTAPSARLRASGTAGVAPLRGTWNLDLRAASSETGVLQLREGSRIAFPELRLDAASVAGDRERSAEAPGAGDDSRDSRDSGEAPAGNQAGSPALTLSGVELMLDSDLAFDPVGPVLEASAMTVTLNALTLDALSAAGRPLDTGGRRLELELALRDGIVDAAFGLAGADLSTRGAARHDLAASATGMRVDALSVALGPEDLPARLAALWMDSPWPLRRGTASLSGSLRWPPAEVSPAPPARASGPTPGTPATPAPDANPSSAAPTDAPGAGGAGGAVVDLRVTGSGLDLALAGMDLGGAGLSATVRADAAGRVTLEDLVGTAATLEYRSAPDAEALRAAGVRVEAALAITGAGLPGAIPEPAALRLDADAIRIAIDRIVAFGYGVDGLNLQASAEGALLDPAITAAVEAEALQAGVELSGLRCEVDATPALLSIRDCRAGLLGGELRAATGHWSRESGDGYVPIALLGLDLGAALALMQDRALAGTGLLDGALPLRLVAGTPIIEDGYLGARPPGGTLRYAADAALRARLNQPGLELVLAAMQDFRFAELGADIDYDADGELALGVRLVGASPDVEAGRRINFNLNVTQNLPVLLESLRLSQEIGADLERRLQERFDP